MRSTGSWYDVLTDQEQTISCRLRGKFKLSGFKVTNPIAVGDRVVFDMEAEGKGFISEILPRHNYIIRKSVHKSEHGHLLATNIDQAVLIVTLAHPRTSMGFIDRFLVTAESFRIPTLLVFNKLDMLSDEGIEYLNDVMALYASLGYPSIATSATENTGIEEFRQRIDQKINLVAGHSGVGKSSLVNTLSPGLDLRTNEVSNYANKGVHTTTFAEMFEINKGTFLIDSPGIKELGLIDLEKDVISHYFPEMRDLLNECKFHNCRHLNEPKCAVKEAFVEGTIAESRYASYLSMMDDSDNRR